MYMRIFRAMARPGTIDDLAQIMQNFIDTEMQGTAGLHHLYCGANRGSNEVSLVSVWDSEQSMAAAGPKVRVFAEQVSKQLAEARTVVAFEVLADM